MAGRYDESYPGPGYVFNSIIRISLLKRGIFFCQMSGSKHFFLSANFRDEQLLGSERCYDIGQGVMGLPSNV
jgi:hypothetical protein